MSHSPADPVRADARPTIAVLGAAPDTGNLGVQALGISVVRGILRRLPHAHVILFTGRPGRRLDRFDTVEGPLPYEAIGLSLSRNPVKPGNLYRVSALQRVGLGALGGPVAHAIGSADLVLDVTGGDSLTSLYGPWRLRYATYPKLFALGLGAPLVLLPQTYGPFDADDRPLVRQIVRSAVATWARDAESRATVRELVPEADVGLCPDVAFTLPAPAHAAVADDRDAVLIGLNASGLLENDPAGSQSRFGLHCDPRALSRRIATTLLEAEPHARLLLVPHVVVDADHPESDRRACLDLQAALTPRFGARVTVADGPRDAMDAKRLIGACDFFVGARMHACIAAVSSGVPTASIAYSDKAKGVFALVQGTDEVRDPRVETADEVVRAVAAAFADRRAIRARIARQLPVAQRAVDAMFERLCTLAVDLERLRPRGHRRAA